MKNKLTLTFMLFLLCLLCIAPAYANTKDKTEPLRLAYLKNKIATIKLADTQSKNCIDVECFVQYANLLKDFGQEITYRKLLLHAWLKAKNKTDLFLILDELKDSRGNLISDGLMNAIISMQPDFDELEKIYSFSPSSAIAILAYLDSLQTLSIIDLWNKTALLWRMKLYDEAKNSMPKQTTKDAGSAEIVKAIKVLSIIANDKKVGEEKSKYQNRFTNLLNILGTKKLEGFEIALAFEHVMQIKKTKDNQKAVDNLLTKYKKDSSLPLLLSKLRLLALSSSDDKTDSKLFGLADKLLKNQDELELVWEGFLKLEQDGILKNFAVIRNKFIKNISDIKIKDKSGDRIIHAATTLYELNKFRDANSLLSRLANKELSSKLYIQAAELCLANHGYKQAVPLIKKINPDTFEEQLALFDLFLRADEHEKAIKLGHKIETTYPDYDPLLLASELLEHYKLYRKKLTSVWRRKKVSLDIYTQTIIRQLNRHVDKNLTASSFDEVFYILNRMQDLSEVKNISKHNSLRKQFYLVDTDIDITTFEFLSRFKELFKTPDKAWKKVAAILAANQNPDFFAVIWEQIKGLNFDLHEIEEIYFTLLGSKSNTTKLLKDVYQSYEHALDLANSEDDFLQAAFIFASISDFSEQEFRQSQINKRNLITKTEKLIEDLKENITELSEQPKAANTVIQIKHDYKSHDLSGKVIFDEFSENQWFYNRCFDTQKKGFEAFEFVIEITTNSDGIVQKVRLRDLPNTQKKARQCLKKRLLASTFDNIDPPFGFSRIYLTISPLEQSESRLIESGLTKSRIMYMQKEINLLIDKFEKQVSKLEKQIDNLNKQSEGFTDLGRDYLAQGLAKSFSSEYYETAAWWYLNLDNDRQSAKRLLYQRHWISVAPFAAVIIPIFIILVMLTGFFIRKKREQ